MTQYTYRYTDECESYDLQDGAVFNAPLTDEELEAAVLADCKDYETNGLEITLKVWEQVWEEADPDPRRYPDYENERGTVILPGLDVSSVDHVHVFEIADAAGALLDTVIAADRASAEAYAARKYDGKEPVVYGTEDQLPGMGSGTPIVDRDGDVITTR